MIKVKIIQENKCENFAGIKFHEFKNLKTFAGMNFREWPEHYDCTGVNFRAHPKIREIMKICAHETFVQKSNISDKKEDVVDTELAFQKS